MKTLFLILLGCGLSSAMQAQDAATSPTPAPEPTPPPAPFIVNAPDFAQWTITTRVMTTGEGEKPAPNATPTPTETPTPKPAESPTASGHHRKKSSEEKPAETPAAKPAEKAAEPPAELAEQITHVTKTKSLRYEQTIEPGGLKIDRWSLAGLEVTVQGTGIPVVLLPGTAADSGYIDHSKGDFSGFEWLSSRHFKGIEDVQGQKCYIYRDRVRRPSGGKPVEAKASINTATLLPVALQLGEETSTYKFEVAPTAMIVLPPAVAQAAEKWQKTMQESSVMPAKP